MSVKFFAAPAPPKRDRDSREYVQDPTPVDWVEIGLDGKDVLVRQATDEDRERFRSEYREFKEPAETAAKPKLFGKKK